MPDRTGLVLGDFIGSRPILSYSDSDATRTAVTDFSGFVGRQAVSWRAIVG
jgi:hypothetical protein